VRQLQNGNPDALTALFEKYSRMVFGVARRMLQNSSEAEEVVQQVFIDTYKAINQFDPAKSSYKTWLYRFAHQRAINRKIHLESKGFYVNRELDELDLSADLHQSAGRLVRHLSSQEAVHLVRQLLKSIQPHQRKAIELTFFYGFTAEEIATRTGETPVNVRHHLYRGLAKLRAELLHNAKEKVAKSKTERRLVVDPAQLL
jgi:RNA polymerase sigma-70 factor (ECF subfamily)